MRHRYPDGFDPEKSISTHVECDATTIAENARLKNFNSRTHVECDLLKLYAMAVIPNFNSRTHVECDLGALK